MPAKKVLIVAYYFPPLGGAGVQRILKFVKYLPQFGWEPTVLTVKNIEYPAIDHTLLEEIPSTANIFRCGSLDPQRLIHLHKKLSRKKEDKSKYTFSWSSPGKPGFLKWFFIPDSKNGWLPFALMNGMRILRSKKIDLIFSSSPPLSGHLAAYSLSRISGKPLVIDLRDPWEAGQNANHSQLHREFSRRLQEKVFRQASQVITVDRSVAETLQGAYPRKKFAVISNGFDTDDFQDITGNPSSRFEIAYIGTFNRWHDPNPFLQAFSELIQENSEFAQSASFTKVGLVLDWDWGNLLREYRLEKHVTSLGYLSHRESLGYLMKSSLLLLTTGGEAVSSLLSTGKIYEYLAVRKPILAIVPEKGEAAELIRKNKAGVVVEPENKPAIKRDLLDLFSQFQAGSLRSDNSECDLARYTRNNLTGRLAEVFSRCISRRG